MVGLSRADARDTRARWWFSGLVVWWFGGLVVWWFSCLVVWLFSGLVVWLFGWFSGLVVSSLGRSGRAERMANGSFTFT